MRAHLGGISWRQRPALSSLERSGPRRAALAQPGTSRRHQPGDLYRQNRSGSAPEAIRRSATVSNCARRRPDNRHDHAFASSLAPAVVKAVRTVVADQTGQDGGTSPPAPARRWRQHSLRRFLRRIRRQMMRRLQDDTPFVGERALRGRCARSAKAGADPPGFSIRISSESIIVAFPPPARAQPSAAIEGGGLGNGLSGRSRAGIVSVVAERRDRRYLVEDEAEATAHAQKYLPSHFQGGAD